MPWALGPPEGRYLLRDGGAPDSAPSHVLVVSVLGAPERRRLGQRRARKAQAEPEPDPTPVLTGRATVIAVGRPLADEAEAGAWLASTGEPELEADLGVLNRALHAFRLAAADPYQHPVGRHQVLVARIGYGRGEEVAEGLWTDARELILAERRQRRSRVLAPQARLAGLLSGREQPLAGEELALRARLDLDQGRGREAALQVLVALDAALAELAADPAAQALESRLQELDELRDPVDAAAQSALAGPLDPAHTETVEFALGRIEAAFRARIAAGG